MNISILLATRKRKHLLEKSINSLKDIQIIYPKVYKSSMGYGFRIKTGKGYDFINNYSFSDNIFKKRKI